MIAPARRRVEASRSRPVANLEPRPWPIVPESGCLAMDSGLQRAPSSPLDGETVLPPADGGARAKVCRPLQAIVSGSGPHLTAETQMLLLSRLRAAALILLVGFAVFLVRHVVGVILGEPLHPVLLGCHALVVLVLGYCALPLCR